MPIYEYLCHSCGAEQEHLQKMSESPIAVCPECGSSDYIKQVSAPGFQLKGSGWYATDFKNKQNPPKAASASKTETNTAAKDDTASQKPTSTQSSEQSSVAD